MVSAIWGTTTYFLYVAYTGSPERSSAAPLSTLLSSQKRPSLPALIALVLVTASLVWHFVFLSTASAPSIDTPYPSNDLVLSGHEKRGAGAKMISPGNSFLGAIALAAVFVMLFTLDSFCGLMNLTLQCVQGLLRPVDQELISWEDAYLRLNSDLNSKRSQWEEDQDGNCDGRDTLEEATRFSLGRNDPHFQSRAREERDRLERRLRFALLFMGVVVAFLLVVMSLITLSRSATTSLEAKALRESLAREG